MADIVDTPIGPDSEFFAFEPKTKNRYLFYDSGIPAFLVKGVARPTVTSGDLVLDYINIQRKIKGKTTWGDISMTLYDPIVPSGAQSVMEWIRLSHESTTGRDGYSDFYKKDCSIVVLGPTGDKVEEWSLKGAWISEANFGELTWSDEGIQEISITLKVDYCILQY